jgi:hypothetical protein
MGCFGLRMICAWSTTITHSQPMSLMTKNEEYLKDRSVIKEQQNVNNNNKVLKKHIENTWGISYT